MKRKLKLPLKTSFLARSTPALNFAAEEPKIAEDAGYGSKNSEEGSLEDGGSSMEEGMVTLDIRLPSGKLVVMEVDAKTPMMDLLVQVTSQNGINPGGLVLKVPSDRPPGYLSYKPSTAVGRLGSSFIEVVPKTEVVEKPRKHMPKIANQPFEKTVRVIVDLPKGQKILLRTPPTDRLAEIAERICVENSLDPSAFALRLASAPQVELSGESSVGEFGTTHFSLISIRTLHRIASEEVLGSYVKMPYDEKQRRSKGFFGLFRKKKNNDKNNNRSSMPPPAIRYREPDYENLPPRQLPSRSSIPPLLSTKESTSPVKKKRQAPQPPASKTESLTKEKDFSGPGDYSSLESRSSSEISQQKKSKAPAPPPSTRLPPLETDLDADIAPVRKSSPVAKTTAASSNVDLPVETSPKNEDKSEGPSFLYSFSSTPFEQQELPDLIQDAPPEASRQVEELNISSALPDLEEEVAKSDIPPLRSSEEHHSIQPVHKFLTTTQFTAADKSLTIAIPDLPSDDEDAMAYVSNASLQLSPPEPNSPKDQEQKWQVLFQPEATTPEDPKEEEAQEINAELKGNSSAVTEKTVAIKPKAQVSLFIPTEARSETAKTEPVKDQNGTLDKTKSSKAEIAITLTPEPQLNYVLPPEKDGTNTEKEGPNPQIKLIPTNVSSERNLPLKSDTVSLVKKDFSPPAPLKIEREMPEVRRNFQIKEEPSEVSQLRRNFEEEQQASKKPSTVVNAKFPMIEGSSNQGGVPKVEMAPKSSMVVINRRFPTMKVASFEEEYYEKSQADDFLRNARYGLPPAEEEETKSNPPEPLLEELEKELDIEYQRLQHMFTIWRAKVAEHEEIISAGQPIPEVKILQFQQLQTDLVQQHQSVQRMCEKVEGRKGLDNNVVQGGSNQIQKEQPKQSIVEEPKNESKPTSGSSFVQTERPTQPKKTDNFPKKTSEEIVFSAKPAYAFSSDQSVNIEEQTKTPIQGILRSNGAQNQFENGSAIVKKTQFQPEKVILKSTVFPKPWSAEPQKSWSPAKTFKEPSQGIKSTIKESQNIPESNGVVRSQSGNIPTPPSPPPILKQMSEVKLRPVNTVIKTQPKPVVGDYREDLLEAIRKFGGTRGFKSMD